MGLKCENRCYLLVYMALQNSDDLSVLMTILNVKNELFFRQVVFVRKSFRGKIQTTLSVRPKVRNLSARAKVTMVRFALQLLTKS